MRIKEWNCPVKWIFTGLVVLSLIADGSLLQLQLLTGASPAYAQDGIGGPGGGPRGSGPQFNRGGPGGPPMQPGGGGPRMQPGGGGPRVQAGGGGPRGPGYGPRPGPRGDAAFGPGFGPGGPMTPRPPYIRRPVGPGPWQAGPWVGAGPAPWWFGRPFLWDLTAAATATVVAGLTYYIINGMYYRPYMQNHTTVYVQVTPPYPY